LSATILVVTTAIAGLTAGLVAFGFVLPAISAALATLGITIGAIAWPITAVMAALALLTAAWVNDWGHIQEKTAIAMEFIRGTIDAVMALIHGDFEQFGIKILETVINTWSKIQEFFPGFGSFVTDTLRSTWEAVENITATILTRIVVFVVEKLATIRRTLQAIKDTMAEITSL